MPTESKTLTEQRIRKEKALAGLRELQLRQAEGKLLSATQVEHAWSEAVIKMRNAMLAVPSRCAPRLSDPKHAEQVIRGEIEIALRQLCKAD
jgi:hypothetical protein